MAYRRTREAAAPALTQAWPHGFAAVSAEGTWTIQKDGVYLKGGFASKEVALGWLKERRPELF